MVQIIYFSRTSAQNKLEAERNQDFGTYSNLLSNFYK